MTCKKISIIIPVYNSEKHLEKCLNSVINQNYKDLEIIIVNDGSTDNSLKIIQKFAKKDKRIKVYNQKNQGGNVALNNGIKYATGYYVHFLDSDDYLENGVYEYLVKKINENNELDLCLFMFNIIDAKGALISKVNLPNIKSNMITSIEKNPKTLIYYPSAQWMIFCKRSLINDNNIKFDSTYFGYDMLFYLNIIQHAKKIYILKDQLVNYRVGNNDSSSGPNTRSKLYDIHFDCFTNCTKLYKEHDIKLWSINVCRQYDVCYYYLELSLEECKVKNYFALYDFSKSLNSDIVNALKGQKATYKKYLSIINRDYLIKYVKNLQIQNNEYKEFRKSKKFRLMRFLYSPFRIIGKIIK